ncbi:hypothetical protein CQ14_39345 [Bradyrhizobium lablabi]|uniref:Uncharacterized protein n=1 Tax=Bradyrhizobium lablabi TaxID=722472 RepID=A0A0R3MNQ7_9BRAD|nr:hypothetical protein CQ14_39345 [Bradyrhizobium lablabi]
MAIKGLKRWVKRTTPTARIEGEFSFYFDVVHRYWAGGASEQIERPPNWFFPLAAHYAPSRAMPHFSALRGHLLLRHIPQMSFSFHANSIAKDTYIFDD